jgi:hypothetical protein
MYIEQLIYKTEKRNISNATGDGGARWPADSAIWRAIVVGNQRWSVIGWVPKNLLSEAPPCLGRHVGSSCIH